MQRPFKEDDIRLTRRQRQVVILIAQGKSNSAIAEEIGVSPRTAEAHRYRIMQKVDVRNAAELVAWFSGLHEPASASTPTREPLPA